MATPAQPNSSSNPLASTGLSFAVMVGGAVLAIVLADVAPRLVNGVLVLILVGLVLSHSDRYNTLLSGITGGGNSSAAK